MQSKLIGFYDLDRK